MNIVYFLMMNRNINMLNTAASRFIMYIGYAEGMQGAGNEKSGFF